jgi:hypothetical protein
VSDGVLTRKVVELQACGPDDPDASRAAEVLDAYFEAERALAFRRLLWRRLASLTVAWVLVSTLFLSDRGLLVGLLVIVTAAVYPLALEWRTKGRLDELIDVHGLSRAAKYVPRKITPSP